MATTERTETDRVLAERERYVARGVATPNLVVARRIRGARSVDVDGRRYVDFAGGLGCQNTGHGLPAAVEAMHEQIDRYLHQCFMVGIYEPYVELCRRLAALSPCRGEEQRSLLVSSGAEAVENAVKVARAATGRPAVVVFDNAFHGRTLLTMTMTSKVAYRRGFGPFAPEIYRAPAPYPYRGVSSDDAIAGLELLFKREVDPASVACMVLEPVQGEGGFIPMPADFLVRLREICDRHGILYVDDEVQSGVGRTGPVWAIEPPSVEPDLLLVGQEPRRWTAAGGRDRPGRSHGRGRAGRARRHVRRQPGRVRGRDRRARRGGDGGLPRARRGDRREAARRASTRSPSACPRSARCAGVGPMLALELVRDGETKEPAPELALATTTGARERGLILLSCGLYGNVVRILVPLVASDEELDRGLDILEESLVAACRADVAQTSRSSRRTRRTATSPRSTASTCSSAPASSSRCSARAARARRRRCG